MFLHLPHVPYRTEEALGELLREIERHSSSVRYEAMANILAIHSQCEGTCTCIYMVHVLGKVTALGVLCCFALLFV